MRKRLSLVLALVGLHALAAHAAAAGCIFWLPAPAEPRESPAPSVAHPVLDAADFAAACAELARLSSPPSSLCACHILALADVPCLPAPRSKSREVHLLRESSPAGSETWKFLLADGRVFLLHPDSASWAFWNCPEGFDPDFFEAHWLYNGYSAVWVGSCHRVSYTPAPAAAPIVAAAPSRRSGSGNATSSAVLTLAAFAPASTPSFSLSCPLPPMPVLALAAETESARAIPEPATAALSLLALAALLARRRRVSPVG